MHEKSHLNGNRWGEIFHQLFSWQDKPFTTFEVSKICGVVHSTISKWVDNGRLRAYRTVGGHRRIQKEDLLHFLNEHQIPVPEDMLKVHKNRDARIADTIVVERKKILIVEDNRVAISILLGTLTKSFPQYDFLTASDGFEAGKLISRYSPCLILLDLFLPGIDGFEVLQGIRQDPLISGTKIIAMTASHFPDTARKLEDCGGVEGFLTKPFEPQIVIDKVQHILESQSPINE